MGARHVKGLDDRVENVMASWDERHWRLIPADKKDGLQVAHSYERILQASRIVRKSVSPSACRGKDNATVYSRRTDKGSALMETEQNMYRNNSLIGMKAKLIDGIHVQVTGRNIIMEGRLDSKGKVNGRQALSMGPDMNGDTIVKGLTDDTISVEKLWDERYWNDFDVDDLENADAVVVNGRAYPALKVTSSDNFDDSTENLIVESTVEDEDGERKPVKFPAYAVSHVLELKENVVSPTKEQGIYRDSGGNLWLNCCSFLVQLRPSNTKGFEYEAVLPGRAIDPYAFPFIRISDTQGNVTAEWKEKHPDTPDVLH